MKKTFRELREIDTLVGELYKKQPGLKDTKFGYAYKRFSEKWYKPLVTEYYEEMALTRVEHALEDEKTKEILTDRLNERGFKYSKEGLKNVIKAENKLLEKFNLKEVEVEPYISSYVPELTDEAIEMLDGILIKNEEKKARSK